MKEIIEVLQKKGAMLSSDIAEEVARKTGKPTANVRRQISRACLKEKFPITRLNLKFPHNESFVYLRSVGFDETFYRNLKEAANKTNSTYAHIFNAFDYRKGMIEYGKYRILSGCPLNIKGHINYDSCFEFLRTNNLCSELVLNDKVYVCTPNANTKVVLAQEKIEDIIIRMLKDWLVKNSFTSFGVVNRQNDYATFTWDITAPCYLYFIMNKDIPGFIVADVVYNAIDENSIKYFLNKVKISRSIKNMPQCIPILVAKYFTHEALKIAKNQGIIATTPSNLFGENTANLFEELLNVLINAGTIASTNFPKFIEILDKIDAIKGASLNLAGDLFEFIVGHCFKKIKGGSLDIGNSLRIDYEEHEIDVILKTERRERYYIECKGYGRTQLVDKDTIEKWIKINKFIINWYKNVNSENRYPNFKFGFITTSDFKEDAKELLETYKSRTKKYEIFFMNGKEFVDYVKEHQLDDSTKIINTLKQHYFKIDI